MCGRVSQRVQQINQELFRRFKMSRKCYSALLGQYWLYCRDGQRYLGKQMPSTTQFITTRYNHSIYKYCQINRTIFLFPLLGQPLSNLLNRYDTDGQISRWIDLCGGIQQALWEVLKTLLHFIQTCKMKEIILDCLRVYNGSVYYWYDSWIGKPQQIVTKNELQIENYYFSPQDLNEMKQSKQNSYEKQNNFQFIQQNTLNIKVIYRICLLILHLGTSELKSRLYQYTYFHINEINLQQRISLFQMKYKSKGFSKLLQQVLRCQELKMQQIWQINNTNSSKTNTSFIKKNIEIKNNNNNEINNNYQKKNIKKNIIKKSCRKQNGSKQSNQILQDNSLQQIDINSNSNNSKQIDIINNKQKKYILKKSRIKNIQYMNLKQRINNGNCTHNIRLIKYLQFEEYLPINTYEHNILKVFENIFVKDTWVQMNYQNGSVYFGEMDNKLRHGQGLYLFSSKDVYYGEWKHNVIHGQGSYIFKSGDLYIGKLNNGCKQGFGKFCYSDGSEYQGYWQKNKKIGLGTVKFPDTVIFIGLFCHKSQNTQGIFISHKRDDIQQWNGIMQKYKWKEIDKPNQDRIKQRKNKLKKCQTSLYCQTIDMCGNNYHGEMVNGKRQGFGIFEEQNQIYEGDWSNNQPHGKGTLIIQQYIIKGIWNYGIMTQYIPNCDV